MPSRRPKALRSANNRRGAVLCRRTSHLHFAEPWMCHETLMPSLMPPSRELLDMFEINDENPWKENIALLAVSSEHLKNGTVCSCVCVNDRFHCAMFHSAAKRIFLWYSFEMRRKYTNRHAFAIVLNFETGWWLKGSNWESVLDFALVLDTVLMVCGFTFPLFRHIGCDFTSRLFNVVTKYLNQWLLLHSWNWDRWDHVSWLN